MAANRSDELSNEQKKALLEQTFGKETATTLLTKYGTYAYDIWMGLGQYASKNSYAPFMAQNKRSELTEKFVSGNIPVDMALDIINSAADRDPFAFSIYPKKSIVTREAMAASAAQYTPKPAEKTPPAPAHSLSEAEMTKLSNFLTRTVGSSDMAEALAVKFGDKAYAVALSAVMEPGTMTGELKFKPEGKFTSKNVINALVSKDINMDEMSSFLDGYAERKSARDAAAKAPKEEPAAAPEEPRRVVKIADIEPPKLDLGVVARPSPENITIKSLPFMQDGKHYDLYRLPENFVIKGDLDLSNRGLTELPDLSKVKVKGNLLLSGNELTSIDGVLPEVGGNIDLRNNKLTSLKGMPEVVKGNFSCEGNLLTTLEGGPREVKGAFDCRGNRLTTLEGGPEKVGKAYICSDNALTSLKGAPNKINGTFACDNNKLDSLEGAPQSVAGDFMADNTMSEELKRDLKNTVKISGSQHLIASNKPTQEDERFDRAFARRSANERDDVLKPFNIIDMMNDIHSYRGK